MNNSRTAMVAGTVALVITTAGGCAMDVGGDADEPEDTESAMSADMPPELVERITNDPTLIIASGSTNKLGNAGFEAPIGGNVLDVYQNWSVLSGGPERSTRARWTGDWGLSIQATSTGHEVAAQMIRVDGNGHYQITTHAKVAAVGTRRQLMYVTFYNLFGRVLSTAKAVIHVRDQKWHTEVLDVTAPGDTWFLAVGLGKDFACDAGCDAGRVYYDTVSVQSI